MLLMCPGVLQVHNSVILTTPRGRSYWSTHFTDVETEEGVSHTGQLEAVDQDLIAVRVSPTPARVSSSVNGITMPSCQKHITTSAGMGIELLNLALAPPLPAVLYWSSPCLLWAPVFSSVNT